MFPEDPFFTALPPIFEELPELPSADKEILMSDVDNGQLSLFDGDDGEKKSEQQEVDS